MLGCWPQWNSPSDVRKAEFHGVKMNRMGFLAGMDGKKDGKGENYGVYDTYTRRCGSTN